MSFDISHILEQWDYQPGQVAVRRFNGKDGVEKIQLRLDLGVLQMNSEGRPDGKRPLANRSAASRPMRVRCVKFRTHSGFRVEEILEPDNDEGESKERGEQHG